MANTVNITNTSNTVTITPQNNNTVNTSNTSTSVSVTQGSTSVVTVNTPGPRGNTGAQGEGANIDTGSLVTTSSFTTYTGSNDSTFAGTASFATSASFSLLSKEIIINQDIDTDNQYITTIANSSDTTQQIQRPGTPLIYRPTVSNNISGEDDKAAELQLGLNNQAGSISLLSNLSTGNPNYIRTLNQDLYLKVGSSGQRKLYISASNGIETTGNITASGHISASTYYGDGSNLTGVLSNPYIGDLIITGSNSSANSHVLTLTNTDGLNLLKVENNGEVITEGPLTLNEPNTGNYVTINPNGNPFLYNFKQGAFGGSIMEVNGGAITFPRSITFSAKPTFNSEIDVPNIELDSSNSDRSIRFWKSGVAARATINHNTAGDLQFRMFDSYTPTTGGVGMKITQKGNVRISGSLAAGTPNDPQLDQRAVIANSTNAYNDVYGLTLPYVSQPTHMGATKPNGNNFNGQIASGSNEITSDPSSPNYLADYTTNYNVGDILQDFNSDFRGVITSVTATTMSLDVPIAKSYTGSSYTWWPKIVGHNKGTVYYNTNTDKIGYWTETQINNLLDSSGSQELTGSLDVSGSITASSFSGDGSGLTGVSVFPFTGSADISGSSTVTGGSDSSDYPFVVKKDNGTPLFRVRSDGYVMFGNLSTDLAFDFTGGTRFLRFFNTSISAKGNTGISATGGINFTPGSGTSKFITFINGSTAYGSIHMAQGSAAQTTFPNNRGSEIVFNREVNHQKHYAIIRGNDNQYQPVPLYIFSGKHTTTYANEPLVLQYYPGAQDGTGSRGNVGIGLEDPQTELHVSGTISASAYLGSVTDITAPSTTTTASLDCSLGNFFTLTLSSSNNIHLTSSNITAGQSINLRIIQPATSGSLTYDDTFKFPNGAPYEVSATHSVEDIVSFISFDSSTLYGSSLKNFE